MEELDYWRLCESLNIVQAALLVVGEAPKYAEYVEGWDLSDRPEGYEAAKTAIAAALINYTDYQKKAREGSGLTYDLEEGCVEDSAGYDSEYLDSLLKRSIKGILVSKSEAGSNVSETLPTADSVDLYRSSVDVDSLKRWLSVKGFRSGFFFPEPTVTMDFLDPLNPRYAPKLAAAVKAWQEVTDAGRRSPKQALDKWLREHAVEYGLTNDEGKPIEQAIEECSKVANWNPKGGATKTPG